MIEPRVKGSSPFLMDQQVLATTAYFIRRLKGDARAALMLQHLHFWLATSENEHDGEFWVYNSYEQWSETLGISYSQARTAASKLEDRGIIRSCKPGASSGKHTKWYRINYEHAIWDPACEESQIEARDLAAEPANSRDSTSLTERTSESTTASAASPSEAALSLSGATTTATETANPLPPEAAAAPSPVAQRPSNVKPSQSKPKVKKRAAAKEDMEPFDDVVRLIDLFVETYNANPANVPTESEGPKWNKPLRLLMAPYIPGTTWTEDQLATAIRFALTDEFWSGVVHEPEDLKRNIRKIYAAATKAGPRRGASRTQASYERSMSILDGTVSSQSDEEPW